MQPDSPCALQRAMILRSLTSRSSVLRRVYNARDEVVSVEPRFE